MPRRYRNIFYPVFSMRAPLPKGGYYYIANCVGIGDDTYPYRKSITHLKTCFACYKDVSIKFVGFTCTDTFRRLAANTVD